MGLLKGRRKSSSNALEEVEFATSPVAQSPVGDSGAGGFRLMSRDEVEKANERKKQEKPASKFPRFSGFGGAGNKGRNHSFDEDSPASSKRDSKSSNGTQFSSSRPYNNGQYGSTSTLPSSAESDPNDNIFAGVTRPSMPQQHGSSGSFSLSSMRKQLPAIPKTSPKSSLYDTTTSNSATGRDRAMTSSSYASTAIPPKLETDLSFGSTSFDDLFSGLQRKESPEMPQAPGRSLLADKRTFQAEPLKIDRKLEVEAPLKSWDSRGSTDNLISSPRSDNDSPPPPVPPHKYTSKQKYAPIASHSPELPSSSGFEDSDAKFVRQSFMSRKPGHDSSSEQEPKSISSSSANSLQTPLSSRTGSNVTTPKPALRPSASPVPDDDADHDDNLFAPAKMEVPTMKKPTLPALNENKPLATPPAGNSSGRVMTQAEFRAYQQRQMAQPPAEDSSDEEDYEDEEDAIKKREEEEIMRRKNQQMSFAREAMRRTTTAPPSTTGRPESFAEGFGMGFPSETSMKADEWEDEDVPLGILAQHGFPSAARNRLPSQPTNAMPSYFRTSTPTLPDRPASAGAVSNRVSQAYKPVFARHLPEDPHNSFIGGGLVRPSNRESLGFSRGPASVAGDAMGNPLMYPEPQLSQPSLVDQIQMRDMTRQKYMGGASTKKPQPSGPFTGLLGQHMNQSGQPNQPTRMSAMGMPGMNSMNGMNGMNPMMGMMGGMNPMMGMNPMGYPMVQSNESMMQMQQMQQMQQMIAMQQMQLQQMQAMSQQPQDPRMSMMDANRMSMMDPQRMSMMIPNNMGFPNNNSTNNLGGGSFLNVPGGGGPGQRPMSVFSMGGNQSYQQQQRPLSTPALNGNNGYTPSIAPSERSNIGLSARYRPVATGHNQDAVSTHSSMTLQASNGASQNKPGIVKGILKNKSPQITVHEEDDENWGKLAARKNKFAKGGKSDENGLEELARAVDGF